MSEETLIILRMVREGKITPEQGAELLRAVDGDGRAAPEPPTPPRPPGSSGNGHGSAEAIGEVQTRLADLQAKLGEVQARLGAARASSSTGSSGFSYNFGLGDMNIGRIIDDAVRGVSSFKSEAVRMAKQAARDAQREARKIRHEARRAGRPFRMEVSFDFDELDRPKNSAGRPEEKATETIEADLTAGKPLRIVNPYGNVHVVGSAQDGRAHIEATRTVWAATDTERQALIESLRVTISTDDTGTRLSCEAGEELSDGTIDLRLTIPAATPVEIETTFGEIHAEELTAGLPKIESLSGNVTLLHLQGDDTAGVAVRTRSGDIALRQWRGGEARLESAEGAVRIDGLKAPGGFARSRSGRMVLANIDIAVDLHVDSASAEIDLRGGQCGQVLSLRSQSGDISVADVRAGRFLAETVSGDLDIAKVSATNGPLTAKSVSGDVQAREVQANEATLNTVSGDGSVAFAAPFEGTLTAGSVSGDLEVRLWSNSSARLDLASQSGQLRCDLALEETHGDGARHLSGRLGAGAGSIKLQSVSGDLLVRSVQ